MDATRWMGAIAVVFAHVCAVMMVDEANARDPGMLLRLMFALKNLGHLAVVIFFVLSGYLVGGRELLQVMETGRFEPARYAIQRFSRIYTVLIPALLLTLVLDQAGQHFLTEGEFYTSSVNGVGSLQYAISGRDDLATFLGNVLMLQTIAVEPFGGDGPLWSLAFEWWYYVAFGLFLAASSIHKPLWWRSGAMAGLLLVVAMMPWTMILLASIWLLGVAAALAGQRWRGLPPVQTMILLLAGFVCFLYCMSWTPLLAPFPSKLADVARLLVDVVPALAFAVALVSAKNLPWRRGRFPHRRLAGFSFSLYAVHFPILLFLGTLANSVFGVVWGRPFDAACAATIAGTTASICLLAWLFAQLTERHTAAVRVAMTELLIPWTGWLVGRLRG